MTVSWHGIYPAATTQFNADQSLNLKATLDNVEKMIGAGMHGMIMLGSVGENTTLETHRGSAASLHRGSVNNRRRENGSIVRWGSRHERPHRRRPPGEVGQRAG